MRTEMRRVAPWGAVAMALVLAACTTPETDTKQISSTTTLPPINQSVATAKPTGVETGALGNNPFGQGGSGDRIYFALDRYELNEQSRTVVGKWGDYLKRQPSARFMIEGHADERGTREYNLALGDRRAIAVREYLLSQGVRPGQLSTVSYGKERPAVEGSNETSWSQNRRAVALIQ